MLRLPYLGNVALTPSVRFCQFWEIKRYEVGVTLIRVPLMSSFIGLREAVSNMPTDSICYFLSRVSGCAIERSERERGRNHCVFFAEMKTNLKKTCVVERRFFQFYKVQSKPDIALLFAHRGLWQYIKGGSKPKHCVTGNFC